MAGPQVFLEKDAPKYFIAFGGTFRLLLHYDIMCSLPSILSEETE